MIIGLTGKNASGKGEAAKFLESRGFHYHSLSDVLRNPDLTEAARKVGEQAVGNLNREDKARERGHPLE